MCAKPAILYRNVGPGRHTTRFSKEIVARSDPELGQCKNVKMSLSPFQYSEQSGIYNCLILCLKVFFSWKVNRE